jgi:VWFA-related protein
MRIPLAIACLLLSVALDAQGLPQSPTIRVSTRLVQIEVTVRDKNGPVAGLTKDDFTFFDHGKPRELNLFSAESGHAPANPAQALELPPNTFSDLPQYGANAPRSITVVLLDNLNTLYGSAPIPYESKPTWFEDLALANAKAHLTQFIANLDPRDRVAIYGLAQSLHVLCDFTSDRAQLLAILKKYDTASVTNRESAEPGATHTRAPGLFNPLVDKSNIQLADVVNETRAGITMAALQSIAAHVANIPGRKNLVWLTANIPFSGAAVAAILNRAQIAAYPVDGRGLLSAASPEGPEGTMDEDALNRGNYMPAQSPEPIGIYAMIEMAEKTGGQAFVNTNDLTGAIRTAVEGSSITYTLGFYLDAASLDGKFHPVKVQVRRSGVQLHYPSGYFAYREIPAPENESRLLLTALQSPLESAAIPLHVRIEHVEQPLPKSLSLSGSIDIHNLRLTENGNLRKGTLDFVTVEQDPAGKILRKSSSRVNLSLSDSQYAACLKNGFSFRQNVQPEPGATTLRIAVADPATLAIGSLIIPLSEVH